MPSCPPAPDSIACPAPAVDPARRIVALCVTLSVWMLSTLLVAWFEFNIFWDLPLLLFAMNLSVPDQTLVVWSLWARTLLVTSPAILIIAFSLRKPTGRLVRVAAWGGHFGVLTWLIVDSGLQCVTGASLWHYVEKAMVTEDWSLGGDVSAITDGIRSALWITGMRICGLFVICHFAFQQLQRGGWPHLKRVALSLSLLAALVLTGIVAAREFVHRRPALEQLYGTMALRTWVFHPDRIAEYGTTAFGTECDSEFADVAQRLHQLCQAPDSLSSPLPRTHEKTTPGRAAVEVALRHPQRLMTDSVREHSPHLVVLFTESLRHNAISKQHTPKLAAWMDRALVAENHYTNSNCSELGAFACLYSRFPLCYDDVLDQQVPSPACLQWRRQGYQRQLIASCSVNFSRMNEFLGPLNFDRTSIHSDHGNPWHDNDQQTLAEIADVVAHAAQPQFIFSILMATHYSYDYPPHYDQQPPACVPALPANPTKADRLRDRYFKALAFLDEQFDTFLKSVTKTNTIVVITGDHGESFLDDGFLCHGTRLSDIQSRTPLLILGPSIPAQQLTLSTSHVDLMPTLLKLAGSNQRLPNCHGQDIRSLQTNRDQLLTMAHTNEWDVLLVGSDARLGLKVPRREPGVKVLGFYDTNGRIALDQKKTPAEIPDWTRRLKTALADSRI